MTIPVDLPRRTFLLIGLSLLLLTAAVYWPAMNNGFVNFDDPDYVTSNPYVQNGLTVESVRWSFTSYHSSNWHPLTWISHMLDVECFGLNPAGHHLVSVAVHALNSLLVFLCLTSLTRSMWRSAFVAALFAVHPLHVESVAWVSERKDVLSGFFFLLSVWAYASYAGRLRLEPKPKVASDRFARFARSPELFYALALASFALGLMSKPMVVTLPCVLLLLDFWPLQRIRLKPSAFQWEGDPIRRIVLEKVPFFFLAFVSSIVTFKVQRASGATASLEAVPFDLRFANAVVSYGRYLAKTFWPVDLSPFYPNIPMSLVSAPVLLAALILVAITICCLWRLRSNPAMLVGWLWFVGMLVPVIGLVQVGKQGFADRYTYLPHIGLFLAVIWGISDVIRRLAIPRWAPVIACAVVLTCCGLLTLRQVAHWQSSKTLFTHAAAVTRDNYVAHTVLATVLLDEGKVDEALEQCTLALRLSTGYPEVHNTLGAIQARKGQYDLAVASFREAIRLDQHFPDPWNGLGDVLNRLKRYDEAEVALREALRRAPLNPSVIFNLGIALHNQNKLDEAAALYSRVVEMRPELFAPRRYLGNILLAQGKTEVAITQFREALRLKPQDVETSVVLGVAWLQQNRPDEAAAAFAQALKWEPDHPGANYHAALVHQATGQVGEAIACYRRALEAQPDWPEALNNLAWVFAANAHSDLRNGHEGVLLAERAVALTDRKEPVFLGTLAAAYAEAGRFPEAIDAATEAISKASGAGLESVANRNRELLLLYTAGKPFHEPPQN